jgi:FMN phosphatase YigB (HAD superfamily)
MSDKPKIILTDADGVLLDWRQGFLDWLPDHVSSTADPEVMKQYNFNNAFECNKEHIDMLAVQFNESDAISRLAPWHDSVEYVKLLGEQGFRFRVITSMGDSEANLRLRIINLEQLYGDLFDSVVCLPVLGSKKVELAKYKDSGLFWIEDHVNNAQDGHNLGLKSILCTDGPNAHYTDLDFMRVSANTPWQDIYDIVLKEYNI